MNNSLSNVRRISRILGHACIIAILFELTIIPLIWTIPEFSDPTSSQMTVPMEELQTLTGVQRYLTILAMMVPSLVMAYSLWRLRKMFLNFAADVIFDPVPINHLKAFSLALMAQALLQPVSGMFVSVLGTLHRPDGERLIAIGFGDTEASTLFLGSLLLVIAWVLGEAIRLQDENRSFV